ncbi:hypothetical protein [Azonexus sp.]|jgi:hypothetical protein|uniref:hypothetical protein n=1 Tax=Azonexus sp. TaxID=1872668 RepID=UPI00283AAA3A|nr:hypothetical protein [Azonexus sp.]
MRSERINSASVESAQADLKRQKNFIAQRERMRTAEPAPHATLGQPVRASASADDPDTHNRIHACLKKITATTRLTPSDEARRKVDCYRGSVGLQRECASRIAATYRLTSDQERHFQQQCHNLL